MGEFVVKGGGVYFVQRGFPNITKNKNYIKRKFFYIINPPHRQDHLIHMLLYHSPHS